MNLPATRARRAATAGLLALGLVAAPAAAGSTETSGGDADRVVHVDPALVARLAAGPAPVLLSWDDDVASRADVRAYLEAEGLEHSMFSHLSSAVACMGGIGELPRLAAAPGALSVWGDQPLRPSLDESVPTAFNGDPGEIWDVEGITGDGVGIAVIDTGIDGTHPDLRYGERVKLNVRALISHREFLGPGNDPPPCQDIYTDQMEDSELTSGHGTHIASVAAGDGTASGGTYKGMAPEADLIGVGVMDSTNPDVNQGNVQLSLFGAMAGINYTLMKGIDGPVRVKVALMGWTADGLYDPWHPLSLAIRDLFDFGISVVLPVGNDGPQASDCSSADGCRINPFAVGPYAIGVGATPKTSRTAIEDYSSRGDPVEREARGEPVRYEPTLVAPGTGVVAAHRIGTAAVGQLPGSRTGASGSGSVPTDADHAALTGTSVSAAHVAGTIALMQQAAVETHGCFLPSQQAKDILTSTATPIAGLAAHEAGAGAVDATAAVKAVRALLEEDIQRSTEPWMCPQAA